MCKKKEVCTHHGNNIGLIIVNDISIPKKQGDFVPPKNTNDPVHLWHAFRLLDYQQPSEKKTKCCD